MRGRGVAATTMGQEQPRIVGPYTSVDLASLFSVHTINIGHVFNGMTITIEDNDCWLGVA
jgi:hypothetical protein